MQVNNFHQRILALSPEKRSLLALRLDELEEAIKKELGKKLQIF